MTKKSHLGKRAASAAISAALVLTLCPAAPIQAAFAEEVGEKDTSATLGENGSQLGGVAEAADEPEVGYGPVEVAEPAGVAGESAEGESVSDAIIAGDQSESAALSLAASDDSGAGNSADVTAATSGTSTAATSTAATPGVLTEGWTQYSDTCEYRIDDGNLTLRPLGGADYAEITSVTPWYSMGISPRSFKIEGTIRFVKKSDDSQGLLKWFYNCYSLETVDLSNFVCDDAVSCEWMFYASYKLTSVVMPRTLKITSAKGMFKCCYGLETLDVSSLVTEEPVDAAGMFTACRKLTSLTLPDVFKVSRTCDPNLNYDGLFCQCESLTTLDVSGLVTEEPVDAAGMFFDCTCLTSIKFPSTFKVSNLSREDGCFGMFTSCMNLTSVDLSGFETDSAVCAYGLFLNCRSLASVKFPETFKVSNLHGMFQTCFEITSLDFSSFDTSEATDMSGMFQNCNKLKYLDLSSFDTSNVTTMRDMFANSYPTTIKLGDKFNFTGAASWRTTSFPVDSVNTGWKDEYNKEWRSSADGQNYASGAIPDNVAATYEACKVLQTEAFKVDTTDEVYTGSAITKTITSKLFVEGEDYDAVYTNNVEAGTATLTLVGKGLTGGTLEYTFNIVSSDYVWDVEDGPQTIQATIQTDADVEWKSSDEDVLAIGDATAEAVDGGKACSVTVTPKAEGGAFVYAYAGGTQVAKFAVQVTDKSVKSIADAEVSAADQVYTGEALEPEPTVTWGGKTLVAGKDYEVSYADNVAVGTATVTVTGKGKYTDSASGMFTIAAASIEGAVVSVADQTYTGEALKPEAAVTLSGCALVAGTDYDVAYADNVDAGIASVTVTGRGNYAGTANGTFTIAAASIGDAVVSVADQTYTGEALKPEVSVTLNEKTLVAGADYDVAYVDNVDAGIASVAVTGKGNYAGAATGTFTIAAAGIGGAVVSVADQTYTGEALKPEVSVTLNGCALVAGTDYDVAYANNTEPGRATVTVTGKGNYAGKAKATFTITAGRVSMHRLYNPFTGEHFYTSSVTERDNLITAGWTSEGEGWTAPSKSSAPVYRLYNPYAEGGDHHYTTSETEYKDLQSKGWTGEGVAWYSADEKGGVAVYRAYNPNATSGSHHFTTNPGEIANLVEAGWTKEGVAWYGVK